MLIVAFFKWWYADGWKLQAQKVINAVKSVGQTFSVSLLLRTLFAPWRRIQTAPGKGIDAFVQAAVDNAVGRFIGFLVRFMVLIAAGVAGVFILIIGGATVLLWPVLPFAPIALFVMGVVS